ncbi:class II aminoacyl-tRNA and biotin synthetases superfamily protein [Artemisia annua]|uniref:Class II aminoacyl-tRNA and biotin synthetases superfamily protein n=1 Tax=Artemisia annua TaxID=35608 RepID=A0A2U1KCJ1_ARTAN|nr:class II aminoacyl-tRNA and biotin synthetases superfamily protein [Artemisia annua]
MQCVLNAKEGGVSEEMVLLVFLISVLLRSLLQMSTLTKGPVFRAEDSYTHRHLCEFTGIDVEMEIKEHYSEVMDIVDHLFVNVFDKLKERCQKELDTIGKQYPITPLKYLRKTLRLTFEEGIQMPREAGYEVDSHGDLNTETERSLGKIVGTELNFIDFTAILWLLYHFIPCLILTMRLIVTHLMSSLEA